MRLRALKAFHYAKREMQPGEEFECEENHVNVLKVIGHAEEIKEPQKRKYVRRDMTAEGTE